MKNRFLEIICLIFIPLIISDQQARVRIGKQFVLDIFHNFMPTIVENLNIPRPFDTDLHEKFLSFLSVDVNVRNFTVHEFVYNKSQYSLNFNKLSSTIDVEIKNFTFNANSKIFHKILFFSNSTGLLDAKMNIDLKIRIFLLTDEKGSLKLILKDLGFDYKGSSISFTGGFLEWSVQVVLKVKCN